jgi:WXG100 family type VII secretion target
VSAPKIQADYDGLNEIAKHFAAKAQDTNCLIQTVDRCVDELRRGAWIGKGANQFYAEMEREVSPAMLRLRNALDDASSSTTRIAQALERHEREAAALFYGGDGTGGAVSAGGAAAAAAGGVLNFLQNMIQGGRDARDGFVKAINKFIGTAVGSSFDEALQKILSGTGGKILGGVGGGFLGGFVDIAFAYLNGTPVDGNVVFDQLVSGGIQGVIAMTGVGGIVLLADARIQILGQGAAQLASDNADWLAYGDLARAESIRQTADRFSVALDNLSIDNRIDGIVGAVRNGFQTGDVLGAVGGVATELGRFAIGGVGGTIVEGAQLAWHTGAGLAARAGDAIGSALSSAQTAVQNFFRFTW